MSFPMFGDIVKLAQPDGTKFKVKAWGDQYKARFETLGGQLVVRDPVTRFFHYATAEGGSSFLRLSKNRIGIDHPQSAILSGGVELPVTGITTIPENSVLLRPRWKDRWEHQKAAERIHALSGDIMAAPPARHTVGNYIGLCLLIDFPDERATVSREEVDAFCNRVGYAGGGNNGSVFDYFHDNSGGKLSYKTIVAPYYRARQIKSYYTNPDIAYAVRAQELIVEALTFHKQQGFDFSALSVDTRGYVYTTNVFYAGKVDNEWGEGLWPHASRLATPLDLTAVASAVDYQVTSLGVAPVLGTYCHENGHMLCDFPDLYKYSRDEPGGIGQYCLMCGGGNANYFNPVNIGAYLKYRAGWGTAIKLTSGMEVVAAPNKSEFFIYSRGREYFILENRQRIGRDKALPDSGLAIWHIDELGSNSEPEKAPAGHRRFECTLVQADGLNELEVGDIGDEDDLFDMSPGPIFSNTSQPSSRWWDGTPSNLQIYDVRSNDGVIKFKVK